MTPLVLYHADCWDGFCAAWIVRKALGEIEAVPVQYGQEPPDVTRREVYILDFSYKRPVMRQILSQARKVMVLDHHKTFDMKQSGAALTWEQFFQVRGRPWLVDYTEDRDLWRWKLPNSREVNAALRSYPFDFKELDTFAKLAPEGFVSEGKAILRREQQIVAEHVLHAREVEIDGYKVLTVNATVLCSDIAGELAKDRPFGACWFDRQDGKRQFSLRSSSTGIDVSEIAKRHGGGGHAQSAGFTEGGE